MNIPKINLEEIANRNGLSVSEVEKLISSIKKGMTSVHKQFRVKEHREVRQHGVIRHGIGTLRTPYGLFWQFDFFVSDRWKKYSVVVRCKLSPDFTPVFENPSRLILRIDSGCESGQKFGDVTCDCKDQLVLAMQEIAKVGEGMIINIPNQDGRGMSNPFKLATLSLQEQLRLTTVEAASILVNNGGSIDRRTYSGVIAVLRFLKIPQKCDICLLTNNPDKFKTFEENGYRSTERIPVIVAPTQHTRRHLEAKQLYLDHKDLVSREEVT